MPTYDYRCEKCDKDYEVVVPISLYDGKDPCPSCGNIGDRIFSAKVHFIGTKIEDAEFNPGLGVVTKSKYDRSEKAKRLGAVEIGNEKPDTIHRHFDSSREEKRIKGWEKV